MPLARLTLLVALMSSSALADEVRLSVPGGGFAIEGTITGFDGEVYELDTIYGPLALNASRVECIGAACPDPTTFMAELRFSGSPAMGGLLFPALLEGFAGREGLTAERIVTDDNNFAYELTEAEGGRPVIRFTFHLSSSGEGFADLLAGEADLVLSSRQIRPDEVVRAADAGLGALDRQRFSRVVALDGLVAIVGPANPVAAISVRDLARVFSGEISDWSDLGGADLPIRLHLRDDGSGVTQSFTDRVVVRYGRTLASDIVRHDTNEALADAVAAEPGAIGIAAFSDTGSARILALTGPCGFPARADALSIKTEDYPLTVPLFAYMPPRRLPQAARRFFDYIQSPAASLIVRRAGFVDQRPETIPIDVQGLRLANAILRSGDSGPGALRAMVERLAGADRLTVTFRFEDGSADLDAQSLSNVALLADAVGRGDFDGRTLLFAGFSDGRGDAAANRRLSQDRAQSVREAVLAMARPDAERVSIEAAGFGEALPMACDEVDWGQRINRRVEVWVR